ncbi:MAG: type 1 glutamine amidotransferase [Candidatus Izimaplasma sp.]|nr:type 1 glutamine amidotransferase [Candidatus Izimaplasma bacterium]
MKKIAILIENLFDEKEFIYPYYRLQEEGYNLDIIGKEKGHIYHSKSGMPITSTLASKDANPKDYAALIIPGGFSPDYMRRTESTIDFAHKMNTQGSIIAAICHGPWLMISSCDVSNRQLTGFYSIKDDIENAGATYVDEDVVVDGNFITSRTPNDLPVFVKTIIDELKK